MMLLLIVDFFHIVNGKRHIEQKNKTKKRFFSAVNITKFNDLLAQLEKSDIQQLQFPQKAYGTFISRYKQAFEYSCPMKNIKNNQN